jgi:F420-dependent oxidoreductase-like protein
VTRFGLQIPNFRHRGGTTATMFDDICAHAQAAEASGFESVWVMDHFWQLPALGGPDEPILEAYTLLGGLAARTERVQLGTLVTGVTYRNPALLAKTVTTLDVISHGRAILGLGAAWNDVEHAGYGFEFPPVGERLTRLDEALQICKLMLTQERPSFEGRYYRIDGALNSPRPIQPGGPQIMVGGGGERRTLKLAARYADITNWFGTLDELRHKNEVFLRHCDAEGRDPSTVLRTTFAPVVLVEHEAAAEEALAQLTPERRAQVTPATPEHAADLLQPYADAGFHGFIFRNPAMPTPEAIGLGGRLIALMS